MVGECKRRSPALHDMEIDEQFIARGVIEVVENELKNSIHIITVRRRHMNAFRSLEGILYFLRFANSQWLDCQDWRLLQDVLYLFAACWLSTLEGLQSKRQLSAHHVTNIKEVLEQLLRFAREMEQMWLSQEAAEAASSMSAPLQLRKERVDVGKVLGPIMATVLSAEECMRLDVKRVEVMTMRERQENIDETAKLHLQDRLTRWMEAHRGMGGTAYDLTHWSYEQRYPYLLSTRGTASSSMMKLSSGSAAATLTPASATSSGFPSSNAAVAPLNALPFSLMATLPSSLSSPVKGERDNGSPHAKDVGVSSPSVQPLSAAPLPSMLPSPTSAGQSFSSFPDRPSILPVSSMQTQSLQSAEFPSSFSGPFISTSQPVSDARQGGGGWGLSQAVGVSSGSSFPINPRTHQLHSTTTSPSLFYAPAPASDSSTSSSYSISAPATSSFYSPQLLQHQSGPGLFSTHTSAFQESNGHPQHPPQSPLQQLPPVLSQLSQHFSPPSIPHSLPIPLQPQLSSLAPLSSFNATLLQQLQQLQQQQLAREIAQAQVQLFTARQQLQPPLVAPYQLSSSDLSLLTLQAMYGSSLLQGPQNISSLSYPSTLMQPLPPLPPPPVSTSQPPLPSFSQSTLLSSGLLNESALQLPPSLPSPLLPFFSQPQPSQLYSQPLSLLNSFAVSSPAPLPPPPPPPPPAP